MESLDGLLHATLQRLALRPRPESTYRLQLHAGFTFRDAAAITDYLAELGITHVYASPYLKAKPGSTHGYDVIDHCSLNPEVGTTADYDHWCRSLQDRGISQILDTVPNHVGVGTNENTWWNDVLTHGPASAFADHFDIAWRSSPRQELHDRILLPVLGDLYGTVLERGELHVAFENGRFLLHYYDRRFPLDPASIGFLLKGVADRLAPRSGAMEELESIATAVSHLPGRSTRDPRLAAERRREADVIARRLDVLARADADVRNALQLQLASLNGTVGNPQSFDELDRLLRDQCYRLAYWHVASDEINYRRFFDINDLAALRMELEPVFSATHAFTLDLLAQGKIAGLRIDHPDGLYDPAQYFRRLQLHDFLRNAREVARTRPEWKDLSWEQVAPTLVGNVGRILAGQERPLYVVVEKILGPDEELPADWAVDGTSGYDFLNQASGLFVDGEGEPRMTGLYDHFIGGAEPYPDIVYRNKRLILETSLASEMQMLAHAADRLARKDRHSRDFTLHGLRDALRELIACFPVYRTYVSDEGISEIDRRRIEHAVAEARRRNPKTSPSIFAFLRDLIEQRPRACFCKEDCDAQRHFAGKFQQLTAPVTAKGIEDTTFYQYNRLVSLNEVGGEPGHFGVPPDRLHLYLQNRQERWPYSLSPLSTHDTKRSEDVRARIHVLSEIPEQWARAVESWRGINAHLRQTPAGEVPDPNEEYLLYQTLIGAWPFDIDRQRQQFIARIQAYMTKALREAKCHTSWTNPNQPYEAAINHFIQALLSPESGAPFLQAFLPFQQRVAHLGALNSLSQTLLKLTAPGAPDTYQGTELWDLSLVDPDNRRPVDYPLRARLLHDLKSDLKKAGSAREPFLRDLLLHKEDGRIKLLLHWQLLQVRRKYPGLFSRGAYVPLTADSSRGRNLFAFGRSNGAAHAIVILPRLLTSLVPDDHTLPVGEPVWTGALPLPHPFRGRRFTHLFTGHSFDAVDAIPLATALADTPFAVLLAE